MQSSLYNYAAKIVRVIDGDTFVASVDLGFRTYRTETFRLSGVNCPEMNTAEGVRAKKFAERWFGEAGGQVILRTEHDKQEKYGRWLADVFAAESGSSLIVALECEGLAAKVDY